MEKEHIVGAKGQEAEGRGFRKNVKMSVIKTEEGKV